MFWKIIFVDLLQFLALSSALLTNLIPENTGLDLVEIGCDATDFLHGFDTSKVSFYLWTRSNRGDNDYYVLENHNTTNLETSSFNGSLRTYVFNHGFTNNGRVEWILTSMKKILKLRNVNIISIDSSDLVKGPFYHRAVCNAFKVADYAATFIDWLVDQTELTPSKIHMIGHSLGAHIAGRIAERVTTGIVRRVTGLDPADPLFWDIISNRRLNRNQAEFVDVIHTNVCYFLGICFGLSGPIGHVDFYPNNGINQPGCGILGSNTCSHHRAVMLFTESIIPEPLNFTATPCSQNNQDCGQGCLNMGFHLNTPLKGEYCLKTNAVAPFAMGSTQLPFGLQI